MSIETHNELSEAQAKQPQLGKVVDKVQEVKPEKPMSIEAYTAALKKEHEVARLRAGIAKFMFEENMAMLQLNQMRAGQHAVQQGTMQPPQDLSEADHIDNQPDETQHGESI